MTTAAAILAALYILTRCAIRLWTSITGAIETAWQNDS